MKILQMARWFFPHHGGGTVRTYEIAKNLVKLGNEVHLLVHHPKSIPHVTLDEEVKRYEEFDGIRVYRLPYIGPPYLYYAAVIPLMAFFAIWIIWKNKIEIILSENPPYLVGAASLIASKVTNTPVAVDVHDAWGSTHYGFLESKTGLFLEKLTCKRVRNLISVNATIPKTLNKRHGISKGKFKVVQNGVDPDRFKNLSYEIIENTRKKYNIPRNKKIVFFLGNLANWNGPEYLVKAVPFINRNNKDNIQILIVGGGKQENELKQIASENNINNIIFTGTAPYKEIPYLLSLADVCVAPLTNPGTVGRAVDEIMIPMLLLDYMASGKPIVGTDVPGIKETLSEGRGIIVAPEDSKTIAKGVSYLLEHEEEAKKMGSLAHEYVKQFSWFNLTKKIEGILTNAKK